MSTFPSWTHTYPLPKEFLYGLVQNQRSSKNWDVGLFGKCVKKFPLIYKLFLMYLWNIMYGLEPIQLRMKQLRGWMNWHYLVQYLID